MKKVSWELDGAPYEGVLVFTDPNANTPGRAQYHPVVAKRAYAMMNALFAEVFTPVQ